MRASSFVFSVLSLTSAAHADAKPYITTTAEYNTECKTCPRVLCPNKLYYETDNSLNATCWTRGTKIMGDDLWLKSEDGCYITQYDILEYEGDYTEDLPYCGRTSEIRHITTQDATLKYKGECRICPDIICDIIAYLPQETEVTLTCWAKEGQIILDDPYWFKSTNNCYISQTSLHSPPDRTSLHNCGPIPLLEVEKHFNENGTSEVNNRDAQPPAAPESPIEERDTLAPAYLIQVTVGEEYAHCRTCPEDHCSSQKVYEFNQSVILQCLTQSSVNNTWWSETTDFCFMNNSDFWESPQGDYYRMPRCSRFEES